MFPEIFLLLAYIFHIKFYYRPQPGTLLKKRLWHRCFSVNFEKFLRTPFLTEHLQWLLLRLGVIVFLFYDYDNMFSVVALKFAIMEALFILIHEGILDVNHTLFPYCQPRDFE